MKRIFVQLLRLPAIWFAIPVVIANLKYDELILAWIVALIVCAIAQFCMNRKVNIYPFMFGLAVFNTILLIRVNQYGLSILPIIGSLVAIALLAVDKKDKKDKKDSGP
jgi:predicted membrane protein